MLLSRCCAHWNTWESHRREARMTATFTKAAAVCSAGITHCPAFTTYQFSEFIKPLTYLSYSYGKIPLGSSFPQSKIRWNHILVAFGAWFSAYLTSGGNLTSFLCSHIQLSQCCASVNLQFYQRRKKSNTSVFHQEIFENSHVLHTTE